METNKIDFVPQENGSQVTEAIRAWLVVETAGRLKPGHSERTLAAYEGGYASFDVGGYVVDPYGGPREVDTAASISVVWNGTWSSGNHFEDPDGSWWTKSAPTLQVSSDGRPSAPSKVARLRLDVQAWAVDLAERFDATFAETWHWSRVSTQAERNAYAAKVLADMLATASRIVVAEAIKAAIHSTCRGMRVNDERVIAAPDAASAGVSEVALERKEYLVTVHPSPHRMRFQRTK